MNASVAQQLIAEADGLLHPGGWNGRQLEMHWSAS